MKQYKQGLSKQQRKKHKQARQLRQAARGKYWLNAASDEAVCKQSFYKIKGV